MQNTAGLVFTSQFAKYVAFQQRWADAGGTQCGTNLMPQCGAVTRLALGEV